MPYRFLLLVLLLSGFRVSGQGLAEIQRQLDSLLNAQEKSEFVLSLSYGNNPAYGGKRVEVDRPIVLKPFLSPTLAYYHKSGAFASVSTYYMFNATQKPFFETDLSVGYDYTKKRDFMAGINYTRYIYADSSDMPFTPIRNELFAYFIYRKWWLEPGLIFDYGWGERTMKVNRFFNRTISGSDFNVMVDVRHTFVFPELTGEHDALLVVPVFALTSGTANYYSNLKAGQYLTRSKSLKRFANRLRGEEETILDTNFEPRALDLSLRVSYIYKQFTVAPSYIVFKPLKGDDRSLFGYFTASLNYTF
ncbi:hypothetical protein MKQ68_15425 [Chitinophaga horti]|uniref:DUF3078 domain-containing protein n=1 Tax=Chitinophaga horti TaxID=2920382 RepID=A0ABY6IVS9_9BACT|nr:hypothetical protein [Chitinophaga horti]UYQ91482.1 hypothetical protein MKQ68_15425 [Chitinophaga horti]